MSRPAPTPDPEIDRDGDAPAAACPHCERPFRSEHARDLHLGEAHGEACTDAEREAYEDAVAEERDDLFYFHLRAVIALGAIWGVTVLLYMVALGSNLI